MSSSPKKNLRLIAIVLPPVLLGIAGLFHPHTLTIDNASQWIWIHIILLPLFALLGCSYFLLISRYKSWPILLAKICVGIYIVFYSTLDTIVGIASGITVSYLANQPGISQNTQLIEGVRQNLFIMGNLIGKVGIGALIGIVFFMYIHFIRKVRDFKTIMSLLGIVGGTGLFSLYHIYFPLGVLAMVLLAVSFLSLEIIESRAASGKK